MREYPIEASEEPEIDIEINASTAFANKGRKFTSMFKEINDVTKSLQTYIHTLAYCRDDFSALIEAVEDEKCVTSSPFYGCRLAT